MPSTVVYCVTVSRILYTL